MLPPTPRCPHCRQPFNTWTRAKKHVKYCKSGKSPRKPIHARTTPTVSVSPFPLDTAPAKPHTRPPIDTVPPRHRKPECYYSARRNTSKGCFNNFACGWTDFPARISRTLCVEHFLSLCEWAGFSLLTPLVGASRFVETFKFLSFRAPTRSGRGISLFLRLSQGEIPHFVRNDKINFFFRSLVRRDIWSLQGPKPTG
jgi:hypothetical protein